MGRPCHVAASALCLVFAATGCHDGRSQPATRDHDHDRTHDAAPNAGADAGGGTSNKTRPCSPSIKRSPRANA